MGTMTFQQKHKLRSSSHPPELLISSDTNPSWGATVIWPQTPAKPHRLLNNRLAAVLVHLLKVKLSIFLQGRPRAVPKPGAEAELSHFCSAQPWSGRSSHHWPHGQQQLGAPEGRKMKEKLNSKCQETLPDGNCHLLSASGAAGLLSSKKSMSGKLFRFSLQALTPALRDNSQTSFSLLGLTSEPQGSPFLAKYRGFYSSLGPTYVCWCKLET